ncbi:MAG: Signal peptidase I, partial [uncultured Solirubrobacteraceae bacterium]
EGGDQLRALRRDRRCRRPRSARDRAAPGGRHAVHDPQRQHAAGLRGRRRRAGRAHRADRGPARRRRHVHRPVAPGRDGDPSRRAPHAQRRAGDVRHPGRRQQRLGDVGGRRERHGGPRPHARPQGRLGAAVGPLARGPDRPHRAAGRAPGAHRAPRPGRPAPPEGAHRM